MSKFYPYFKEVTRKSWFQKVISFLGSSYLRFVIFTARKTIIHPEKADDFIHGRTNMIGCFWHGRLALAPFAWKLGKYPVDMLISQHNDGKLISSLIHHFHIGTIAGSTGKNGIKALKIAVEKLKNENSVCFTPDGPKGPRYSVSEGVIATAKLSAAPIIPAGFSYSFVIRAKSWDHFFIPLPFGRLAIVWGDAFSVPSHIKSDDFPIYQEKLKTQMDQLTQRADEICGHPHHIHDFTDNERS